MEQSALRPLSDSERDRLETAVSNYAVQFTEDAEAYLEGRGIGLREVIGHRLGVVGGSEVLPEHQRFNGMLAIPYLDRYDNPLSVRFRCFKSHDHREAGHGKYNSMSGEIGRMYNIKAIFKADDTMNICEGELDAIILTRLGYSAVAIPGAQAWKSHHRKMLAGFSRVYVWGDPDEAGADFSKKVAGSMRQAKIITSKLGDVNETFSLGGPDAVAELIEKAG